MIATHNINVNGKWIRAGERYEEAGEQERISLPEIQEKKAEPETETATEPETQKAEKQKTAPKSSTRRKVSK